MDRLRALRVFVRVAERQNFNAAAADLGLSHGMASATVKEIEAGLGTELIRRTTRRMALTDAGRAYLERARRILDEVDLLDEEFRGARGRLEGKVTIQSPVAFARIVLAPALTAFRIEHPGVTISVLSRDRLPDMVGEDIDILIYVGPLPDSGLVARRIGQFPLVTAAAPGYLAQRGVPRTPDDLVGHDLLDITSATTGRPLDWQFQVDGRRLLRPAKANLSFEASDGAISAALAGAGIVQNISYALADHVAAGRLVPILRAFRDPGPEMHLVMRRQRAVPARIDRLSAVIGDAARRAKAPDE
jgi:DNA-binding transcriptional LysR family regulator